MPFDLDKLAGILNTDLDESNAEIYKTAFTHRSYLNEHSTYANPSNERLEFLGDAVLQLLSSQFLYHTFPEKPEGDMTNYRAALVNTQSLAEESRRLGYGELLLMSKGEEQTGGRDREYILANTFEAVLGSLYLTKGLDFCKEFVNRELTYKIERILTNQEYKDSKSKLQETAQEKLNKTPRYEVIDSWGLDHEKTFKIGVFLGDELFGEGEGRSKQKAEQSAAQNALDKLNNV